VDVDYRLNPPVENTELDHLYAAAWPNHRSPRDFGPELVQLLAFIGAYLDNELIGWVKLAWDGAAHAFLLEPTVHPRLRHRRIGRTLVQHAVDVARKRGLEWVHVDYEPRLANFYRACGFEQTAAGVIRLGRPPVDAASANSASRRVIVIFPNVADLASVTAYRNRWDPLASTIEPHLTLVFPFADAISPRALDHHIRRATSGIQAFNIRLSGVSGFEGENIFANVKIGNDPLIALHDALYTGPLQRHLSLMHTFVPHVTIGRVADQVGFARALEEATSLGIDARVLAQTLSVYRIEADGSRSIETEVSLGA
jgi:2'-5' RNA ligase/GNAT superfamily N-acetyltransferase